ncbi:vacuolar protein sorting-associated protein 4B-like [Ixodes scapularis]|uniref:vacuolar protein sorting-associated protein 4B-like n=1 Tax=Ixodes scapularis TaxID=6945 RepID=UPI001A9F834C|nr:vacuolar protein sorting-associated protein 4B-like [Ixodes scapularis]
MRSLCYARKHAQRAALFELLSNKHSKTISHYTQATFYLEEALETILHRIRRYSLRLEKLRPHVTQPELWLDIVPHSNTVVANKRYLCEFEGLVVFGQHCGRCVDMEFIDVLRQAFHLLQIPSLEVPLSGVQEKSCKTLLVSGPDAVGKCSFARAFCTRTWLSTACYIYVPEFLQKPQDRLLLAMATLFSAVDTRCPTAIILDRLEALCQPSYESAFRVFQNCIKKIIESKCCCQQVIGITNTPWLLSPQMQSLFQRRVYVPLPDEEIRALITRHLLSGNDGYVSDLSLQEVADATVGFTSSQLAMCLRSPFWHINCRQKLNERFVELLSTSGVGSTKCLCLGNQSEEEYSLGSEAPFAPHSSPLLPIDDDLMAAIEAMTRVRAKNPRERPPESKKWKSPSRCSLPLCAMS